MRKDRPQSVNGYPLGDAHTPADEAKDSPNGQHNSHSSTNSSNHTQSGEPSAAPSTMVPVLGLECQLTDDERLEKVRRDHSRSQRHAGEIERPLIIQGYRYYSAFGSAKNFLIASLQYFSIHLTIIATNAFVQDRLLRKVLNLPPQLSFAIIAFNAVCSWILATTSRFDSMTHRARGFLARHSLNRAEKKLFYAALHAFHQLALFKDPKSGAQDEKWTRIFIYPEALEDTINISNIQKAIRMALVVRHVPGEVWLAHDHQTTPGREATPNIPSFHDYYHNAFPPKAVGPSTALNSEPQRAITDFPPKTVIVTYQLPRETYAQRLPQFPNSETHVIWIDASWREVFVRHPLLFWPLALYLGWQHPNLRREILTNMVSLPAWWHWAKDTSAFILLDMGYTSLQFLTCFGSIMGILESIPAWRDQDSLALRLPCIILAGLFAVTRTYVNYGMRVNEIKTHWLLQQTIHEHQLNNRRAKPLMSAKLLAMASTAPFALLYVIFLVANPLFFTVNGILRLESSLLSCKKLINVLGSSLHIASPIRFSPTPQMIQILYTGLTAINVSGNLWANFGTSVRGYHKWFLQFWSHHLETSPATVREGDVNDRSNQDRYERPLHRSSTVANLKSAFAISRFSIGIVLFATIVDNFAYGCTSAYSIYHLLNFLNQDTNESFFSSMQDAVSRMAQNDLGENWIKAISILMGFAVFLMSCPWMWKKAKNGFTGLNGLFSPRARAAVDDCESTAAAMTSFRGSRLGQG